MKAIRLVGHHGDVGFYSMENAPMRMKRVDPECGRVIVARGEATGHHHSFSPDVEVCTQEDGSMFRVEMPDGSLADALFARVLSPAEIIHKGDEHAPTVVETGDYWIVTPREYDRGEIRRSLD